MTEEQRTANSADSEPAVTPFKEPEPKSSPSLKTARVPAETEAQLPADEHSSGAGEEIQQATMVPRRSRWYSSLAALQYVSSLSKDDDVRVRDSDRATAIFLLISATLTVLSLVIPTLAPHRLTFMLVCDILLGVMLVFYVANRFGILNTLSPRQALLSWQLMMGASFLGIFMTINLAVIIALIVAHTYY